MANRKTHATPRRCDMAVELNLSQQCQMFSGRPLLPGQEFTSLAEVEVAWSIHKERLLDQFEEQRRECESRGRTWYYDRPWAKKLVDLLARQPHLRRKAEKLFKLTDRRQRFYELQVLTGDNGPPADHGRGGR
jgi:hypothetical protein